MLYLNKLNITNSTSFIGLKVSHNLIGHYGTIQSNSPSWHLSRQWKLCGSAHRLYKQHELGCMVSALRYDSWPEYQTLSFKKSKRVQISCYVTIAERRSGFLLLLRLLIQSECKLQWSKFEIGSLCYAVEVYKQKDNSFGVCFDTIWIINITLEGPPVTYWLTCWKVSLNSCHFWTNTLGKCINLFISPAMD